MILALTTLAAMTCLLALMSVLTTGAVWAGWQLGCTYGWMRGHDHAARTLGDPWIDCRDRMPEKGWEVLVYCDMDGIEEVVDQVRWDGKFWHSLKTGLKMDADAFTHWQFIVGPNAKGTKQPC